MTTKTYTGHIINGRITGIGQQLSNDIKDIESQEILLTIEPVRRTKTLQQLRAFHGTVLDQVQQCHSVFSSFDKYYEIAEAFVKAYPLNTKWGIDDLEYEETIESFTLNYINKNSIRI